MITTEEQVEVALQYLNIDPHPLALARKDVTDAENAAKQTWAREFVKAVGPVDARKAAAETAMDYVIAKATEAEAIRELERQRAKVRGAEMIIEVWRSENANARAAERIR